MPLEPPFTLSHIPAAVIGTNAVPTPAPTPACLMSHNPQMIMDCFLTDSRDKERMLARKDLQSPQLLCQMLSALVLAAWVKPGDRSPDLVAGPDYARSDLAKIKLKS